MLTKDMKFLDADIDKTHRYGERLSNYEVAWNSSLKNNADFSIVAEMEDVLTREGQLGFVPSQLYAKPPFSSIARLMDKNGLSNADIREFLTWSAKNENVKKARDAKAKKAKKALKKSKPMVKWFMERKRRDYSGEL